MAEAKHACSQVSRLNNVCVISQLPDHIARSLQHPVHETDEPFPYSWSERVQCVRAAHIISHSDRKGSPISIGETSHICDFAPFINQVMCQKKQHSHGVLLLGVRRSKVQAKGQSHMLVWNLFEKDPISRVMTNGQFYTILERLKTVKDGNLIPLMIPSSDREEWVYMANKDQVNPGNLSLLAKFMFNLDGASSSSGSPVSSAEMPLIKIDTMESELKHVYNHGFYTEPNKVKFSSEISTMVNSPLASPVIIMYDFFFLVV